MGHRLKIMLCGYLLLCCGSTVAAGFTQREINDFAKSATLTFAVIDNAETPRGKLNLRNDSAVDLRKEDNSWAVYFHFLRKISSTEASGLRIEHIQGDLHRITPTAGFNGLKHGEQITLQYRPSWPMVAYSEFLPRAFIHSDGIDPAIFKNTDSEDYSSYVSSLNGSAQLLRDKDKDLVPTASGGTRHQYNRALLGDSSSYNHPSTPRIIPMPLKIQNRDGRAELSAGWYISFTENAESEARHLNRRIAEELGYELELRAEKKPLRGKYILIDVDGKNRLLDDQSGRDGEAYALDVSEQHIVIKSATNTGAFYGIQSLLNLAATKGDYLSIPALAILDRLRLDWRGMHYDMARNFHGKDAVIRLIAQMARYKLNKLHLHLTEDEGWRIEIPGLEELTRIGGNRCFDLQENRCLLTQLGTGPFTTGSGNGYFSSADFIEIVQFAAEHHIEVIPEIDMPGHARAAVVSMKARYRKLIDSAPEEARRYLLSDPEDRSQYLTVQSYSDNSINVCLPSTYQFVDKVMTELTNMYQSAGVPLEKFHMGGDEVGKGSWTQSPACAKLIAETPELSGPEDLKRYFAERIAKLAASKNLSLMGWEDGLMQNKTQPFERDRLQNPVVIANAWDNIWELGVGDRAYQLANQDYQVVLSHATDLYFDHPYEADPMERGAYWAARYTDTFKVFRYMPDFLYENADKTLLGEKIGDLSAFLDRPLPPLANPDNVIGMQGHIWTEMVRSREQLEYMIYPRLLALAERAWHKPAWEKPGGDEEALAEDFVGFAHVLTEKEFPRLDKAGINFRLPVPGAIIDGDTLFANVALPGLPMEYSEDAGDSWKRYREPVKVSSPVYVRSRLRDRVGRATLAEKRL